MLPIGAKKDGGGGGGENICIEKVAVFLFEKNWDYLRLSQFLRELVFSFFFFLNHQRSIKFLTVCEINRLDHS